MEHNKQAMEEAMRLASSPMGQQLLKMLQQSGGPQLNHAMEKAAGGDYTAARAILTNLMQNPQAKALWEQMGGHHGTDGR